MCNFISDTWDWEGDGYCIQKDNDLGEFFFVLFVCYALSNHRGAELTGWHCYEQRYQNAFGMGCLKTTIFRMCLMKQLQSKLVGTWRTMLGIVVRS